MIWIELIGWIGIALLLLAFYLASSKRISDRTYSYHVLNLIGALAVFVNVMIKGIGAVAALEVAWSCIALVGMWKIFTKTRSRHALE